MDPVAPAEAIDRRKEAAAAHGFERRRESKVAYIWPKIIKVVVKVTQQDIDAGKPGCWETCPIGLATRRAVGCVWLVDTSPEVDLFAGRFDAGFKVSPFEFETWVPEPHVRPSGAMNA